MIDDPTKLYFYKYLKGGNKKILVGDIILSPTYNENNDVVVWTMDNPKGNSFSRQVLQDYIDEKLNDFSKITDKKFYREISQSLKTPINYYISEKDENKFMELVNRTSEFNYKELFMYITPFNIDIDMNRDGIFFSISMTCHKPYDKNKREKLQYEELKEKLDYYKEWDSYFEYIDFYLFEDLLDFVSNNMPTIYINNVSILGVSVRYFTPSYSEIKIW